MQSLIESFGIDWKLLVSQVFNFLVIFGVITFLVYKPLAKSIAERRKRIAEGLEKSEEADHRLKEVSMLEKETLKKAETEAMKVIASAEEKGKKEESKILKEAEEKGRLVKEKAMEEIAEARERSMQSAEQEIASLAKEILVKAVKVSPSAVDEALLAKISRETMKKRE